MVTDDAPAIQAKLDEAAGAGGGVVHLPAGTYTIGVPGQPTPSLLIGSRVTLRGDGPATIIRRAESGHSRPLIHNRGRTKATGGTGEGDTGIVICDLALDGAQGDTPGFTSNEQGVWLSQVRDSVIDRVWSYNHRTNGLCLEYCDGVAVSDCMACENLKNGFYLSGSDHIGLTNCRGYGNGSRGIGSTFSFACSWHCTMAGCQGWRDVDVSLLSGRDTQYLNVTGGSCDGVGVTTEPVNAPLPLHLDRSGAAGPYDGKTKFGTSYSTFTGLTVTGNQPRRFGVRFVGGRGNLVSGCLIRGVALNGIQLHGSSNNTIRGCKISNVGLEGDRSFPAGVCIVADKQWPKGCDNTIESNEITDDQTPPTTLAGILVYANPGGSVDGARLWRNSIGSMISHPIEIRPGVHVDQLHNILV